MSVNPLDEYKEFDPKIVEQYQNMAGLAYAEGALSAKFKLLIAKPWFQNPSPLSVLT